MVVSIALGYEVLKAAEQFALRVNGPVQTWWCAHPQASEDAVYLHSPNENNSACLSLLALNGVELAVESFRLVDRNRYHIGVLDRAY